MLPQSLGFLVFFLWVQGIVNETEVVMGIIGNAVELRCHNNEKEPLVSDAFRVHWQIEGEQLCYVDAYVPGENQRPQCPSFSNRTRLSEKLKQGDFTLQLLNISHNDEHKYSCYVQKKKNGIFSLVQTTSATLQVAANYSKPVLTGPVKSGEEMTFTCNSSHGYPKPKVYWINQTDNSLLNDVSPLEPTQEPSGTFSVSSTLVIKAAFNVEVGCVVENERLHQNVTTSLLVVPDSGGANNLTGSSQYSQPESKATVPGAVAGSVVVLLLAILLCVWWWYKRKPCLQQKYADVCQNEAANGNTPAETPREVCHWTTGEISGDVEAVP